MMNETDHKPTSRRIYRELTREERARVAKARAEAAAKRDEIVREGRIHKAVTLDEVLLTGYFQWAKRELAPHFLYT